MSNSTNIDIVDRINNSNIFVTKPFYRINKNLNTNRRLNVTFAGSDSLLLDSIKNEVNSNIRRYIFKEMYNTPKFDSIDIRSVSDILSVSMSQVRDINMQINNLKEDYTNLVLSGAFAVIIQDSSGFSSENIGNIGNVSDIYSIGNIFGIKVYVDPYLRYDDETILLFKTIDINIENIHSKYVNEATIHPRILTEYNIGMLSDSKILYLVKDNLSKGFLRLKQSNRDNKINEILD